MDMSNNNKKIGIQVARAILTGDVDAARRLAHGRMSWSVPEARAITGACRVLGQPLVTFVSFCAGSAVL